MLPRKISRPTELPRRFALYFTVEPAFPYRQQMLDGRIFRSAFSVFVEILLSIDYFTLFYYILRVSFNEILKRLVRPTGLFYCQKAVFIAAGLSKDLWNTHLTKALSITMNVPLL